MRHPLRWLRFSTAAALSVCAGCAGGSSAVSDVEPWKPIPINVPRLGIGPPEVLGIYDLFEAFPRTDAEFARENATAACMAARGWTVPRLLVSDMPQQLAVQDAIRSGDRESIAKWGYGIVTIPVWWGTRGPGDAVTRSADIRDELEPEDLPRFSRDYVGPDPDTKLGGCLGWAHGGVDGHEYDNPTFFDELGNVWLEIRESDDYRALAAAWRACMVTQPVDIDADEPAAVYDLFEKDLERLPKLDDDEATTIAEHEVAVALADFACRDEVGYSDRIVAVMTPFVEEVLSHYPDALTQTFCDSVEPGDNNASRSCTICVGSLPPSPATSEMPCTEVEPPAVSEPTRATA